MAHDIWSKRFYARGNFPAWHKISIFDGTHTEEEKQRSRTAANVMGELFGNPTITRQPLFITATNLTGEERKLTTAHVALVLSPTSDNPEPTCLGVVSDSYELITPQSACEMWDNRTGLPVETMAFLRRGGNLFITGIMPEFSVSGDEVHNYLILNNPMDGLGCAGAYVSSVRVVCQNTLSAAIEGATTSFRIRHYPGAANDLAKWLQRTYEGALATVEFMKIGYNVLAKTQITEPQAFTTVEQLYKLPTKPKQDVPRKITWEEVVKQYEYRAEWIERARDTVKGLYAGGLTGFNEATSGTAWGLWNSVAEFETWRRGTEDSMSINCIVGDRAKQIQRAYNKCMDFVPSKN